MKALQFIYQDTQIHFLLNPLDNNVMVNATEMAKLFNRRIDYFLKAEHTQKFIDFLKQKEDLFPPNGGNKNENQIIYSNKKAGTFMCEVLALKFAAWLDVEFEYWIYKKIQNITFGNYKKHWEAHAVFEDSKQKMEQIKQQLLSNPTEELVHAYFSEEKRNKNAKNEKSKAIRNQLKMMF